MKAAKSRAGFKLSPVTHNEISLGENTKKKGAKAPDYIITCYMGTPINGVDIGAAWKRTSKTGGNFLSVKLDCPALPAPIFARLSHPVEGQREMVLEWIRDTKPEDREAAPSA